MDATQLFLKFHGSLEWYGQHLFDQLSEEQMRLRPHPNLNSLVWLLWHMARCEDIGVQRLVGGRPQLLDQGNWMERMNAPWRHGGTGMPDDEVSILSAQIDLAALHAYWVAVRDATITVVTTLQPNELDEGIDPTYLHQVLFDEGGCRTPAIATFIESTYHQHNKGWFLTHMALTHNYGHFYEAAVVCKLMGVEFWQ